MTRAWGAPRAAPTSCGSSSTRRRPPSCSRAERKRFADGASHCRANGRAASNGTVTSMRVIGGREPGPALVGPAPRGVRPDLGPGARGDLRHPRVDGRRGGPLGGSTCSAGAAPWASRPCRGARPRSPSSIATRRHATRSGQPGRGRPGRPRPPRWSGRASRVARRRARRRPRPLRPALRVRRAGPPPRRPRGGARGPRVERTRSRCPTAGSGQESAATAVRSSPWFVEASRPSRRPGRSGRERRPLPGVLRPLPQRPPRGRRAGQPALRRGRGGRAAQPPEERAALRPRRAPGDARGVGRPPRPRCGSSR